MDEFKGSHGTSIGNLKLIKQNGFRTGRGRIGIGIYFWADQHNYDKLARYWWKDCLKRGKYKKYRGKDKDCAVIFVKIEIPEEEVLDLDHKEFKKALAILAEKRKIDDNTRKFAKLYSILIKRIEEKNGVPINMYIVRVPPPESYKDYLIRLLGVPISYVVKKNNYIIIEDII